jgi:hypothetical protein
MLEQPIAGAFAVNPHSLATLHQTLRICKIQFVRWTGPWA